MEVKTIINPKLPIANDHMTVQEREYTSPLNINRITLKNLMLV